LAIADRSFPDVVFALIATAIELACPLVTYDERIVRFGKKHGRQYRFAVDA